LMLLEFFVVVSFHIQGICSLVKVCRNQGRASKT